VYETIRVDLPVLKQGISAILSDSKDQKTPETNAPGLHGYR
jgi:hypothetical protein